jgi:hypothetical protein
MGGALVLTKIGFRSMHSIAPYERKWLLVMSCIFNVTSECMSNFYIFKGSNSIKTTLSDVNLGLQWLCS